MPKGFQAAKKAGEFKGSGFQPRPPGINYFSLKGGETAVVRFTSSHEDIDWARKWKLPPSGNYKYGEFVNSVDQHENGTPDPGYAANLGKSFKGYPVVIWRNQPTYVRDPQGKLVKDAMGNKQVNGFADQVAVWECSYAIYENLGELEIKYRSITNLDWEVKRIGSDKNTKYIIQPADVMQVNVPMSPEDQRLLANFSIDVGAVFCKIPTFEELSAYINGEQAPVTPPTVAQQTQNNAAGLDGSNPFM